MSSTAESRPKSRLDSASRKYVDFDEFVAFQLEKARSGIRANDLLMGTVGLGVFVASYLLVFLVLDQWVFAQGVGTGLRLVMWLGMAGVIGGWIAWKVAVPFMRRVTSLFAAQEIESAHPDLKSNLLTLVDLRNAGREVSPQILQALEKRTAVRLSEMDIDHAIDRRGLMKWSYILLGIVAVTCVYTLLTPKRLGPSLLRALIPLTDVSVGTQTRIEKVTPGDASIHSRAHVEILAQLTGKIPEEVRVLFSTEDRRFVDEPLILTDTGEGLNRFRASLTGERGQGLLQSVRYRVEAGDAISPTYTITVTQPPSATVADVAYDYPTYTGLQDRTQANPTIDGWEGTRVTLRATTNRPVQIARVLFSDSEDTVLKAEELPMKVEDGTQLSATWMLQFRKDGTYPHFYRIFVRTEDGSEDPQPTLYPIRIRADLAPKVEIIHPQSDVTAPANGSVQVAWQASDPDFLLKNAVLRYEQRGQELPEADYVFESPPLQPSARGVTTIDLKRFSVVPGDKLTFWLEARDNLEPFGDRKENLSRSARLNINIVDAVEPQQAEQQARDDQQRAQDQLDQAPPPPQDERGNPEEQRPNDGDEKGNEQPQDQQPGEGDPKPGEERRPGENPESEPGMNDNERPMPGDNAQGMGENGADKKPGQPNERANPDQGNDPKGTGQPGDSDKGHPQSGDPNKDDMPPPMGGESGQPQGTNGQSGGKGQTGQPQRNGPPSGQPQREPGGNPGTDQANPGDKGSEPRPGAPQRQGDKRPPGSSSSAQRDPADAAPDDVALEKLLNYADKKPDKPQNPENDPGMGETPGESPKNGGSGSRPESTGSREESPGGPDSMTETGSKPKPGAEERGPNDKPSKGDDASGKAPMEKPGQPGTSASGAEKPKPGEKMTDGQDEPQSPMNGTGEKGSPSTPPPGTPKTDPANGDKPDPMDGGPKGTGRPMAGGNEPMPSETPESASGMNPDGTPKPDGPMPSGENPKPSDAGGRKTPSSMGEKGTPKPEPGDQGAPMSKPMPGGEQNAADGAGPMPAPMPGDDQPLTGAEKPNQPGAGNQKPAPGQGTEQTGAKPNETGKPSGDDPMPGTGMDEEPGKPDAPNNQKPMPGEKATPGEGTGQKAPSETSKGGQRGQPGPSEKPMPDEKGRPTSGDPRQRPMGMAEQPSAKSNDKDAQRSPNPMQGGTGRGQDAAEGQPGGKQPGQGDTTSKPGPNGTPSGQKPNPSSEGMGPGQSGGKPSESGGKPSSAGQNKPGGQEGGMPESGMPDKNGGPPDSGGKPMQPGTGNKRMNDSGDMNSAEEQPGKGPQPGDMSGGKPEAGNGQPGDKAADSNPDSAGGEKGADSKPAGNKGGAKPGQPQDSGKGPSDGGQQPGQGGKSGGKPGEQGGNDPGQGMGGGKPGQGEGGEPGGPSEGPPGQAGPGGGRGGAAPPDGVRSEATTPMGPDEGTDLSNRKKAVNLMLNRLQDELRRGETDPELLKELGFNENDLQQFLKRLDQQLNAVDVDTPEGQARQRQFEELLKGLDSRTTGETRAGGDGPRAASGSFTGRRSTPPTEYAESAEAYKKRLSRKKPITP